VRRRGRVRRVPTAAAVVLCIRPEQMRLVDPASSREAGTHRVEGRNVSSVFWAKPASTKSMSMVSVCA